MEQNKTGKYFKYAIGEVILVVIGILIALWLNNLNQINIANSEKKVIKDLLAEELKENLVEFNSHKLYLETSRKKLLYILNISQPETTLISIDSIRKMTSEIIPINAIDIQSSRLISAKSSGKFSLFTNKESAVLSDYETALNNYQDLKTLDFKAFKEGNELFIYFSTMDQIHNNFYPNDIVYQHLDYKLNDDDFIAFLKSKETYTSLHRLYLETFVEIAWLTSLEVKIANTLEVLKVK